MSGRRASARDDLAEIIGYIAERNAPAARRLRAMIEAALAANAKVILLTPTGDLRAKLDDAKDPLNQHAEQIRRLAAEYHVGLVDSLAQFKAALAAGTPLTNLMAQVNHPNAAGHKLVAEQLVKHGACLSIGQDLTKENSKIRAAFFNLPMESVFFETDEWQQPVWKLYAEAARVIGWPENELKKMVSDNFIRCFKRPENSMPDDKC